MWQWCLCGNDAVLCHGFDSGVIGLFGFFLQPSTQSCSCWLTQSHEELQSGLMWDFFKDWLFTVEKTGECFNACLEWAVIHCNFDTSSIWSTVFPLLTDVGDTHFFCCALPHFCSLNASMHNHLHYKYLSRTPLPSVTLLPPTTVCLI